MNFEISPFQNFGSI